jgi:C_GCAxxG_C_C family probable redox protein
MISFRPSTNRLKVSGGSLSITSPIRSTERVWKRVVISWLLVFPDVAPEPQLGIDTGTTWSTVGGTLREGWKTMETNRATELMAEYYVCSESVLLATCEEFGIEVDEKVIPKIAYAFAGGIGNTGAVCGAVAGAIMAIGLIKGRGETMEEMLSTLGLAGEFRRRFEAEMETISCRELTGIDLTTQEGIEQLMSSDVPQTVCFQAVATAYRLVVDLLKEAS